MKKTKLKSLAFLSLVVLSIHSCKSKSHNSEETKNVDSTVSVAPKATEPTTETKDNNASSGAAFDINTIPETDKVTGIFPYFKLPMGYHLTDPYSSGGTGQIKDYDKEYFMVHGTYVVEEGKTFKADMRGDEGKEYSNLELQKNFDEFIQSLGGVIVNNGESLKDGEEERIKKTDSQAENNKYLFTSAVVVDVHTYVIRTKEKTIWVQVNFSGNDSHIAILETKAFKNGMSQTSAALIKNDIDQKGKSVLHINFQVDKSILLPNGEKTVDEITKVLRDEQALKLSIEGHTDNSGDAAHNKQLSIARANSVKDKLVQSGISENRLKTVGYGSEKPLVPNNTEENKGKNRRVELVKI